MLIDTHCHLYLSEFDKDRNDMINRALANSVTHFYLPAIDKKTHHAMLALEALFPKNCFAMAGLHPCSVREDFESELSEVAEMLRERSFVAIGEAGLDLYWDKTFYKEQVTALEKQCELALAYHLPIVLHTRHATRETIDVIARFAGRGLTGVFHCFGGTLREAQQIIDLGFLLGIGGVLTYKNSGLDNVVREINLGYIVLETDAPYLSPVPHRGKRNESSFLPLIAEKLANIKGVDIEEVTRITTVNAKLLFKVESINV